MSVFTFPVNPSSWPFARGYNRNFRKFGGEPQHSTQFRELGFNYNFYESGANHTGIYRSMKSKASRKHTKEYSKARARYPSPEN